MSLSVKLKQDFISQKGVTFLFGRKGTFLLGTNSGRRTHGQDNGIRLQSPCVTARSEGSRQAVPSGRAIPFSRIELLAYTMSGEKEKAALDGRPDK